MLSANHRIIRATLHNFHLLRVYYVILTETISVRIDEILASEIKKLGVNITQTVRSALEEEVKRRKHAELKQNLTRLRELFAGDDFDTYLRALNESRGER